MTVDRLSPAPAPVPQQLSAPAERIGERENDGDADDAVKVAQVAQKPGYLSPGVGATVDLSV